jgi:hypothetical protein
MRPNHAVRIGQREGDGSGAVVLSAGEASVREGRVRVIRNELTDRRFAAGEVNLNRHLVISNSTDYRVAVALNDGEQGRLRLPATCRSPISMIPRAKHRNRWSVGRTEGRLRQCARMTPEPRWHAAAVTPEEFKKRVLGCVVEDVPWDTSLVWADADRDLAHLSATERDEVVARILGELLDDGLVYFYEAADFGSSYTREVPESAGLPREDVTAALSQGSRPGPRPGKKLSPWLVIGATEKGRAQHHQA